LNQAGASLLHRHRQAGPEPFLQAIAPSGEAWVGWVEGLGTWSWRADRCTRAGRPCVLGPALSLKAIAGGKAKHDTSEAQKMAVGRRGGMLPQAYVYPAAMRASRARLRRRRHLPRQRAARLAQIQHTPRPDHLPAIGKQLAYQANRDGGAERVPEPAVQKRREVDVALMGHSDSRRTALERALVQTATAHAAQTFSRLGSLPEGSQLLALGLRYDIHASRRFPRGQEVVAVANRIKPSPDRQLLGLGPQVREAIVLQDRPDLILERCARHGHERIRNKPVDQNGTVPVDKGVPRIW
jgi:hypothetical protein